MPFGFDLCHVTSFGMEFLTIPHEFNIRHTRVTLVVDVMTLNGVAFLVTMSRKIRFTTAVHTPRQTAKALSKSITKILKIYFRAGFRVEMILGDMQFDAV